MLYAICDIIQEDTGIIVQEKLEPVHERLNTTDCRLNVMQWDITEIKQQVSVLYGWVGSIGLRVKKPENKTA